ncbi:MAG: signal peptidase II [Candidatus Hydrogenedentes bacterium]|nr:signal peptidase II [Candidatus Hydrogenedentota bacterium]
MNNTYRYTLISTVVFSSVIVDQISKYVARATLASRPPIIFLDDLFRFHYAENTGAFLSLGDTLSDSLRFWLLTGVNSLVLLAVAVFLVAKPKMETMLAVALSLILSGGIGNLIDRIVNDGRVIDFMNLGLPWVSIYGWEPRTGIFNVADVAIVAGLVLVFVLEFTRAYRQQQEFTRAEDPET